MKFIQSITPQGIQKALADLGDGVEVVSIYAVGTMHVAWYREKKAPPKVKKDLKGSSNGTSS